MVDIINAVMLNMYEKPETRDVMVGINPDSKYDEVDVMKKMIVEKDNVEQVQTEQVVTDHLFCLSRGFGRNNCLETRLTQNLNFYPSLLRDIFSVFRIHIIRREP